MSSWSNFVNEFKGFLNDNGCYAEFEKKTLEQHDGYNTLEEYLLDFPVIDWLSSAFYWSNQNNEYSKDQLKYWSNISGKFQFEFLGL